MARHSFIQMSKLSNVKGRISYISDPKRQEYLYATFSTREDMTFWNDLAKECQEEFKRFGTEGKCIEARELIIALPEEYTKFDPNQVLREFTEQFKKRYDVECVSALHHNKTKKNYHILKEDGYPDVQAFKRTYDDATALVEQYNRDLAAWERQVHGGQQPQQKPPEKESIRKKLRDMEAEAKRRNDARRQQTRPRSHDYDRGR